MENRIDRLTAVHLNLSVNVSFAFGLRAGVEAAHELSVPASVAQRVLIEGGPRRETYPSSPISSPDAPTCSH